MLQCSWQLPVAVAMAVAVTVAVASGSGQQASANGCSYWKKGMSELTVLPSGGWRVWYLRWLEGDDSVFPAQRAQFHRESPRPWRSQSSV